MISITVDEPDSYELKNARHILGLLSDVFQCMARENCRSYRERMWCERFGNLFERLHLRRLRKLERRVSKAQSSRSTRPARSAFGY